MSAIPNWQRPAAPPVPRGLMNRVVAWIDVAIWRHGWCWPLAVAALLSAATIDLTMRRPLVAQHAALERARLRPVAPPARSSLPPDPALRGQQIEAMLLAGGSFEQQLQQLIEIAARHDISLPRADYVSTVDATAGVERIQVHLTIAAQYPQVRAFIEEALRNLPAASVDQFALKRDSVMQAQAEVMVRLSFWRTQLPRTKPVPSQRHDQVTSS